MRLLSMHATCSPIQTQLIMHVYKPLWCVCLGRVSYNTFEVFFREIILHLAMASRGQFKTGSTFALLFVSYFFLDILDTAHYYVSYMDCLGCAVLLCLVCLFDLACFFLSSFSSLI